MNREELLVQANRLLQRTTASADKTFGEMESCCAQVVEFLRCFSGENSTFYRSAFSHSSGFTDANSTGFVAATLNGFIEYVKAGLYQEIPPERESELNLMSDYLSQAQSLLEDKAVSPAAAAMVIGATLEEFLRNWIMFKGFPIDGGKESISSYVDTLRKEGVITKQDVKEVNSWAGLRNLAAHGRWEELHDRKRVQNIRDGVNLFMMRHRYG